MTRSTRWRVLPVGFAVLAACLAIGPTETSAQQRAVRRSSGPPVTHVRTVYRPYYRPYYGYGGWYGGWNVWYGYNAWYGWNSWYGWPGYGYYAPYGPYPYGYYYDPLSEARLQVEPRHAEVFIDGYFVGTVDDFDGWSQRLRVEPGKHQLEIYLPGHRTYRQPLLFRRGATIKIQHVMQPLAAGDPGDPRPTPAPGAAAPVPRRGPSRSIEASPDRPDDQLPRPRSRPDESGDYGAIAVRVQPADAEVIVDGERWDSPQAGDLTLQLTEGSHRVEVRRSGYRPYSADVRVRRGQTTTLNVSLSRE